MKIVIDISAEDFEKVKCGRGAVSMMRRAIIHGTPLPDTNSNLQPTCNQLATDCISRQAVIEWLKDKDIIKTKNQEENARRELAELPSVEPERKMGHWEDCSNGWMCSECKHDVTYTTKYCPNCGARMGVQNEV